MTTHKVYVDTENLSREQLEQLLIDKEEENKTLKDKIEFLTKCLDDRDKSINLMEFRLNKLEDVKELFGKIVIDLEQLDRLKKIVYKKNADLED